MEIEFKNCPHCGSGDVLAQDGRFDDPLCLQCGCRVVTIPPSVLLEVQAKMGEGKTMDHQYRHAIARGKPGMSGWQKKQRKIQRELEAEAV